MGCDEGGSDLVAVGNLVLPIEVVPDVDDAVHSGDEEDPSPCWAEAPARQVRTVILQRDNKVGRGRGSRLWG